MTDTRAEFTAAHDRANGGDGLSALDDLAAGGDGTGRSNAAPAAPVVRPPTAAAPPAPPPAQGGAAPPPAAAPAQPPPPTPPDSNLPFGQEFDGWLHGAMNRIAQMTLVPPEQRQDKSLGAAVAGGFTGIPAEAASEFGGALKAFGHSVTHHFFERPENIEDLLDRISPTGMMKDIVMPAANIPLSLPTGAWVSAVGRPLEYETGIRRDLSGLIMPLGTIAKAPALAAKIGKIWQWARAGEEAAVAAGREQAAARGAGAQRVAGAASEEPPPPGAPPPGAPAGAPPAAVVPPAEGAAEAPSAATIAPQVARQTEGDIPPAEIAYRDHPTTPRLKELDTKMETGDLTPDEQKEYLDIQKQRQAELGPMPEQKPIDFTLGKDKGIPSERLTLTPEQQSEFEAWGRGDPNASPVNVSLEAMADPERARQAILDIGKVIPKTTMETTQQWTAEARDLLGEADAERIDSIMRSGRNPELARQQIAMQMILRSAGNQLRELAMAAVDPAHPNRAEAMARFGRGYALANNYARMYRESGGDLARGFRARQVGADAFSDLDKALLGASEQHGTQTIEELASRFASLGQNADTAANIPRYLAWLQRIPGREAILQGFYNFILSNPAIVAKKLSSDLSLAAFNVTSHLYAEHAAPWMEKLPWVKPGATIPKGSTAALLQGYLGSAPEAFRLAWHALRTKDAKMWTDFNMGGNAASMTRDRIGALARGMPGEEAGTNAEEAAPWFNALLPTTWIGSGDNFAKYLNYRASIHSQAWQQAVAEAQTEAAAVASGGRTIANQPPTTVAQRYQELVNNPTDQMHFKAASDSQKFTLTEPLDPITQKLSGALNAMNVPVLRDLTKIPIGRFMVPVIKVGVNSLRWAYRMSPLSYIAPSTAWKAEMDAGGPRAAMARAQRAVGTTALMALSPLLAGMMPGLRITGDGPTDPGQRHDWLAAGNQPNHIYFGSPGNEKALDYSAIEPLHMVLTPAANYRDAAEQAVNHGDMIGAGLSLAVAFGHALSEASSMDTFSGFVDAVNHPDKRFQRWWDNTAAGWTVPGGVRAVSRAVDPYLRMHNDYMSTVESGIPFFSKNLPPEVTTWGDPIKRSGSWFGRMGAPGDVQDVPPPLPIDKWIKENENAFPDADMGRVGFMPPGNILHLQEKGQDLHIQLSLKQWHDLKVLAGQGQTTDEHGRSPFNAYGGSTPIGAKDAFNALVTNNFPDQVVQDKFNAATPEGKMVMLTSVWQIYRKAARLTLQANDPELASKIDSARKVRDKQVQGEPEIVP